MILLDTNVLSELMRPKPEPQVVRWLDARPDREIWISAVTVAEIRLGIFLLPEGKRRERLQDLAAEMSKGLTRNKNTKLLIVLSDPSGTFAFLPISVIGTKEAISLKLRKSLSTLQKPYFRSFIP